MLRFRSPLTPNPEILTTLMKVLVTTTSFMDTPGPHHDLLQAQGWEVVSARGPLSEDDIFALVDAITVGGIVKPAGLGDGPSPSAEGHRQASLDDL